MSEELHPLEEVTTIYFLRHGHTMATEMGLLYSNPDLPLTEKGAEQAQSAAGHLESLLKGRNPDKILRGTALRVKQSAEPLVAKFNLETEEVEGFEEWQVGDWEGRTYLDIKKNSPEQYQAWCKDPIGNAPPGGESISALADRIGKAIDKLTRYKDYAGKTLCMVTHSGIIRSSLVYALEMPIANFWRFNIPTGSITRIDFSPSFATVQFTASRA